MLTIIIQADFAVEKTGIMSTARGLLQPLGENFSLFSNHEIAINGVAASPHVDQAGNNENVVIFSHMEYSRLPQLLRSYPGALVHVGDWPGNYWHSLTKAGSHLKGFLGGTRFRMRLGRLPKTTRFAFVSEEDYKSAVQSGYPNALHIPIGIHTPSISRATVIDKTTVCFSGNFRYEPNRRAAVALIHAFRDQTEFKLMFVGYHATDLQEVDPSIEVHADVSSVIDFLAARRPLYVSLVDVGAGAKNKILEAAVAGCPIVCTESSLDASTATLPSIYKVGAQQDPVAACREIAKDISKWMAVTDEVADSLAMSRSWTSVSRTFFNVADATVEAVDRDAQ